MIVECDHKKDLGTVDSYLNIAAAMAIAERSIHTGYANRIALQKLWDRTPTVCVVCRTEMESKEPGPMSTLQREAT